MTTNDPISDLIVRIKNGCMAKKKSIDVPASKLKKNIIEILQKEGFVKHYKVIKDDKQDVLKVFLNYYKNESVIQGIMRVSRPGLRRYVRADNIPIIRRGLGLGIISTSTNGVVTSKEAKKLNVGGEYICKIW